MDKRNKATERSFQGVNGQAFIFFIVSNTCLDSCLHSFLTRNLLTGGVVDLLRAISFTTTREYLITHLNDGEAKGFLEGNICEDTLSLERKPVDVWDITLLMSLGICYTSIQVISVYQLQNLPKDLLWATCHTVNILSVALYITDAGDEIDTWAPIQTWSRNSVSKIRIAQMCSHRPKVMQAYLLPSFLELTSRNPLENVAEVRLDLAMSPRHTNKCLNCTHAWYAHVNEQDTRYWGRMLGHHAFICRSKPVSKNFLWLCGFMRFLIAMCCLVKFLTMTRTRLASDLR